MNLLRTSALLSITFTLAACEREGASPGVTAGDPTRATSVVAEPPAAPAPATEAKPATTAPSTPASPSTASAPVTATPKPASDLAKPAAGAMDDSLEIKRLVLATRVVEREPELAALPRVNEPLVAFVEAKNSSSQAERITVTFEHESGTKVGFVELEVPGGAKRWRTWARTRNLKQAGSWTAIVRTSSGEELGRTPFTVSAG